MIATGLVVEYNPFHNGHYHHINQSRKQTKADVIIAVMSGHFLQRGEPAFIDKWSRTRMALSAGADIVIELPYVFATAQASDFAKGAITILDAVQCDYFCFGSEEGTIQPFLNTYDLIQANLSVYDQYIKEAIQTGISYPKALNIAYNKLTFGNSTPFVDMTKPNNILGYHYIEASKKIESTMTPETIQRIQAGYHDAIDEKLTIASATGIRKAFFENGSMEEVSAYLPQTSTDELTKFMNTHGTFGSWEHFWPYLRLIILRLGPTELRKFAEVTEGIEHLIYSATKSSTSFNEFMIQIKSKRYTWTRIQRMLTHIYTNFTWDELKTFDAPSYIRLLGMTQNGQKYLRQVKKELKLPMISRVASSQDPMLLHDIQATDLYMLGLRSKKSDELIGIDYSTPPLLL